MKRSLAYITAAWRGDPAVDMEQAAHYCRVVYIIRKNGGLFQPLCWSNPPFFCRAATQRWKQAKNKIR